MRQIRISISGLFLIATCANSAAATQVEYRLNPQNHYVMRCTGYLEGAADDQLRRRDEETKLSLTGQSPLVNSDKCSLWDGEQTNFTLTISDTSRAMVKATLSYPSDPSLHTVGYFFKEDLLPTGRAAVDQNEIRSTTSEDVLASIRKRLGDNVAKHTLAYSVRTTAEVVLTDISCPQPVPDPRFNGGYIAFLLFDRQPGALPGCYVTGMFGGIDLKWANGYGDTVKPSDMNFTARGRARFPN